MLNKQRFMAEGGEAQAPDNAEEWDRIKHFVGGSANQGAQHPLEQEAERARRRQPQNFAEGGMPDVPQGTLPPPPADYNAQASDIMGGITPDVINRLSQSLNHNQKMGQIGAGIAGIGDAIASVGGQHPGHMQAAEEQIQQNRQNAMQVPGQMAAAGKERFGISQTLQEQDPNSPLSKKATEMYQPLLPKELRGKPVSIKFLSDITGKNLEQLKIEADEKLKEATLANTAEFQGNQQDIERQRLTEESRRNQSVEAEAARAKPLEAAKELQGRPWYQKAVEAIPSFGLTTSESTKKLREEMNRNPNGGTPAPHGDVVKQNGVTYHWNGSSYEAE